jgi:YbgC/YbaW family acyl-CoA thioester hydrolase
MNFLEEARKWFLAQYGFNLKEMFARDLGFIVTRYEIDYKLSLVAGEEFVIETSMEQISRVQVKFMLKTLKKHQKGGLSRNPRKFRHPRSSPAKSASTPDLACRRGEVGGGRASYFGCLGALSEGRLTVRAQHLCKRGLAGQLQAHPKSPFGLLAMRLN